MSGSSLYSSPQLNIRLQMPDSLSLGVFVYLLDFIDTHCSSPPRDVQAELTWVAGFVISNVEARQK